MILLCLDELRIVIIMLCPLVLYLTSAGNLLQLREISVEDIRISAPGRRITVLPDRINAPSIGQRTNRARIPRNNKRRFAAKGAIVSSTQLPPTCRGVNERILGRSGVVSVDKVVDPADHGARTQAVAAVAARSVLEIKHTRKGDAIRRPASSVLEEVVGLGSTGRGGGLSKMVTAPDEASCSGFGIMIAEAGISVGGALSSLSNTLDAYFMACIGR